MTDRLAEGEFTRKARAILRQLGRPGCRLVESDARGLWLIEAGPSRRRTRQTAEGPVVREMARRDWLMNDPAGGYRRSAGGERWLAEASGTVSTNDVADQHRLVVRPGAASKTSAPAVNEAESPLGWLRSRRDRKGEPLISAAQFEAGERLRTDFTTAQLSPRVTASWEGSVASGARGRSGGRPESLDVNERAVAAKQRFLRALDAVGPELSDILVEVCCLWRGLEAAERRLDWPQRSGKLVLQMALTRLARHYGLIRPEREVSGRSAIRHWGTDDYRPRTAMRTSDEPQA